MPNYIFYDENGTIYKKKQSISSHLIEEGLIPGYERTVKVDNINIITKFHKVENGVVRLMTQAEKDVILQAEEDARILAENQAIENFRIELKEVLTALIKRINVRIPSNPITKQEIIDEIKNSRNP